MPTTIRVRYGTLEFSVGRTLMIPFIHIAVNHRRNIYTYLGAHARNTITDVQDVPPSEVLSTAILSLRQMQEH